MTRTVLILWVVALPVALLFLVLRFKPDTRIKFAKPMTQASDLTMRERMTFSIGLIAIVASLWLLTR